MKVLLGIVLVVILVSGFIRAKNTGDIFNPKIIFAFPIFVSFCVNLVFYDSKMSISEDAYFIYMTSVACFCIGLYLMIFIVHKTHHLFDRFILLRINF